MDASSATIYVVCLSEKYVPRIGTPVFASLSKKEAEEYMGGREGYILLEFPKDQL